MEKLLESDPELARFVAQEEQNLRLKKAAEQLTNECWDLCVTNPSVAKFDSKTESCLVNCVERFIDSSTFIVNTFSNKVKSDPSLNLSDSHSGGSSFGTDAGMILEDKFSSKDASQTGAKTKSGFKFW